MVIKVRQATPIVETDMTPPFDVMLVLLTLSLIALSAGMPPAGAPCLLTLGWTLAAQSCDMARWPAVPFSDDYFVGMPQTELQPEIHLNANKLMRYDIIAEMLAEGPRIG